MAVFLISTRKIKKTIRNNQSFLVIITKNIIQLNTVNSALLHFSEAITTKTMRGTLLLKEGAPQRVSSVSFQ